MAENADESVHQSVGIVLGDALILWAAPVTPLWDSEGSRSKGSDGGD